MFYDGYNVHPVFHKTFPEYLDRLLDDGLAALPDMLNCYNSLNEVLSIQTVTSNENRQNEVQVEQDESSAIGTLKILQFNAPHGIQTEFLCSLPNATASCQQMSSNIQAQGSAVKNKSDRLILDLDFVIVQAWEEGLIGIKRHQAALLLERKMAEKEISFDNLPQLCISKEHEDLIWERTLKSERIFGNTAVMEAEFRQSFEVSMKKFCSVDAVAALKDNAFRGIFDECAFQSKYKWDRLYTKKEGGSTRWNELGCNKNLTKV